MFIASLNRQGYREVKLHVILVGAKGTIYKDYTDKPLADLILNYHKIRKLTHKLSEHSIRHASALIKTRYALQYNTSNNSQGLGPGTTAQLPWPTLISFELFAWWGVAWCGHLSNPLP